MTHYKTIGVQPNATASEIKQAYRDKAVQCHPDKGGDIDEFKAVAHAYDVLKNPSTRLLYDTTGQDRRKPIDQEVQGILMELFSRVLSSEEDVEVVADVRGAIEAGNAQFPEQVKKLKARKKKLEAKRGKIKAKGVNLVHMLIDKELQGIEGGLLDLKHKAEVGKACLKALKAYSEEWEAPPVPAFNTFDLRR